MEIVIKNVKSKITLFEHNFEFDESDFSTCFGCDGWSCNLEKKIINLGRIDFHKIKLKMNF